LDNDEAKFALVVGTAPPHPLPKNNKTNKKTNNKQQQLMFVYKATVFITKYLCHTMNRTEIRRSPLPRERPSM
jgi:hypothetical protein